MDTTELKTAPFINPHLCFFRSEEQLRENSSLKPIIGLKKAKNYQNTGSVVYLAVTNIEQEGERSFHFTGYPLAKSLYYKFMLSNKYVIF